MIRLATGQSTQRSELDAEHLTERLPEVAVQQLEQAPEDEVWLIADSSDLRKPYAEAMPYLIVDKQEHSVGVHTNAFHADIQHCWRTLWSVTD